MSSLYSIGSPSPRSTKSSHLHNQSCFSSNSIPKSLLEQQLQHTEQQQQPPPNHQQDNRRTMQPLRSGSIASVQKPLRSIGEQMEHHLEQGVHRSINPLYPLPFLTKDRQAKLNALDARSQDQLVKMIVERHRFRQQTGGVKVDMRAKALDYISEKTTRRQSTTARSEQKKVLEKK